MSDRKRNTTPAPDFAAGQRWISELEPELGIGTILRADHRMVTVAFLDGETARTYMRENSPLRRIQFKPGDAIHLAGNVTSTVESVEERDSLLLYKTAHGIFCETQLSGENTVTDPLERLLNSRVDSNDDFRLRADILDLRFRIADSPVRGYVGGRIELIPHQLYIAGEVSSRFVRRIMLADEVGLGKTIEACLILHRLLVSGRISQALIIVPESMVYVWFVELLRKFNLRFSIVGRNGDDGAGDDGDTSEENPFSRSSLVLTGMDYFAGSEETVRKACEVSWDAVVVDEAHHLVEGSATFDAIRELSHKTKDLYLLTATPQQYGERNHFARLRILDPSRYSSFEGHCREAEEHKKIAAITGKILDGADLDENDLRQLQPSFGSETVSQLASEDRRDLSGPDRRQIVAEIIDRQGIGRALFRNTRAAIGGFPGRSVTITVLDGTSGQREAAAAIVREDLLGVPPKERSLANDPRVDRLADLLKGIGDEKLLVICRSNYTVTALNDALRTKINVKTALFHEELTLLQRDRNAAWFSDEEGARVLICSEIGGEGRNFQFARHLLLFDLPVNPELVEQRIGRLDRIGQKGTVSIHIPVLAATPEAFLARWYDEGLGIFAAPVPAAQEAYELFQDEIRELLFAPDHSDAAIVLRTDRLIAETKKAVAEISARLQAGRDRLLEQHSFRPNEANELISMIRSFDNDRSLKAILKRLLKSKGILVEEFREDTWNLLSESRLDECFPGLDSSHSIITFNRTKALQREDYEFMSIDHPALTGGIDLFIGSETGNACFAIQKGAATTELLLEAVFVAECIAPPSLFIDRFLPPFVFRIIVDHTGSDRSDSFDRAFFDSLEDARPFQFIDKYSSKGRLPLSMIKRAEMIAKKKCRAIIGESLLRIKNTAGLEVERLKALKKINPGISDNEITLAEQDYSHLTAAVNRTIPRLEAARLIWRQGKTPRNSLSDM